MGSPNRIPAESANRIRAALLAALLGALALVVMPSVVAAGEGVRRRASSVAPCSRASRGAEAVPRATADGCSAGGSGPG